MVFDSARFAKGGWIERNRVLHPRDGWSYIRVPLVKHPGPTPIKDIRIRMQEPWREKLFAQLAHYRRIAPFYAQVIALLKEALDANFESIAALNVELLMMCCRYLGVPFRYRIFSNSTSSGIKAGSADEWGLQTAKAFGAAEYINAPGGMTFFDNTKYERGGVRLTFLRSRFRPYDQRREHFESGLSIIDAMMFNESSTIRDMLDEVDFLPGAAV